MSFESISIQSSRNGNPPVTGYREDLSAGDTLVFSLTSSSGLQTTDWAIFGRPEFSIAGGAGPNPYSLGNSSTASFVVDSDSGSVRRDGTYLVVCIINQGAPNQTRKDVIVSRLSGLTIPGPVGNVPLRKLAPFEALEDTSVTALLAGWATQINRWLEFLRSGGSGVGGGASPVSFVVENGVANTGTAGGAAAYNADFLEPLGQFTQPPTAVSGGVAAANVAYCAPFVLGESRLLDAMFYRSNGAGSGGDRMQVGVYDNLPTAWYPRAKLFDSGPVAGATVRVSVASAMALVLPDGLYWVVVQVNASWAGSSKPLLAYDSAFRYSPGMILGNGGGDPVTGGFLVGWTNDLGSFGTLPTTFPTAGGLAAYNNAYLPTIFGRWKPPV